MNLYRLSQTVSRKAIIVFWMLASTKTKVLKENQEISKNETIKVNICTTPDILMSGWCSFQLQHIPSLFNYGHIYHYALESTQTVVVNQVKISTFMLLRMKLTIFPILPNLYEPGVHSHICLAFPETCRPLTSFTLFT